MGLACSSSSSIKMKARPGGDSFKSNIRLPRETKTTSRKMQRQNDFALFFPCMPKTGQKGLLG